MAQLGIVELVLRICAAHNFSFFSLPLPNFVIRLLKKIPIIINDKDHIIDVALICFNMRQQGPSIKEGGSQIAIFYNMRGLGVIGNTTSNFWICILTFSKKLTFLWVALHTLSEIVNVAPSFEINAKLFFLKHIAITLIPQVTRILVLEKPRVIRNERQQKQYNALVTLKYIFCNHPTFLCFLQTNSY